MTTPATVLNRARSYLGMVEDPPKSNHNDLTERFADISGWEWARRGNPWCDMAVSVWLIDSGVATPPYAYTPTHRNGFKNGQCGTYVGGRDAGGVMPGDIVFYSFRGTRTDHVGIVESAHADGRITTIEGNVGDAVRRQIRTRSTVTGFGRPSYSDAPAPAPQPTPDPQVPVGRLLWPTLSVDTKKTQPVHTKIVQQVTGAIVDGWFGPGTRTMVIGFQKTWRLSADGAVGPQTGTAVIQNVLRDWGFGLSVDGDYGPRTTNAVRSFQQTHGLAADGIFGNGSTRAMHDLMGL